MASEIRVDKINSLSGVGTVTLSPTGVDIAGITTAATLRATTGIVTSLTAGSLTSLGAISGTTGTFSGAVSGTTGTFSAAVSGTTGTFTGDVDIADKIVHTGDTNTALRFPAADTVSVETGGSERLRIDSNGRLLFGIDSSISGIPIQIASGYIQQYVAGNDANPGYLDILKTRNTSASGNTILQDGDRIGSLRFRGNTGSGYVNGAVIRAVVNGTPGSGNDLPTELQFHTMPDGSGSTMERLRIEADGDFRLSYDDAGTNYAFIRGWDASTGNMIIGADQSATGSSGSSLIFRTRGSEKVRILNSGGITFNGDTATANALDDYEEGTWTPDWRGASALGTTTYGSYNVASYVKIGNQVTVRGYSELNGSSGGSGFWFINNLPFTVGGGDDRRYRSVGSVMIENFNLPDNVLDVVLYVERNNNDAQLRGIVDNATSSANISVNNDDNFEIYFTITYPTVQTIRYVYKLIRLNLF